MQRALGRAIEALATVPLSPSLYGGFTGVAWVADLLSGDSTAALDDDPNAAVDAALESYLNAERASRDPYDLVDGLVGIGVYALERTARPSGRRVLAWVVRRLAEAARRYPPGVAWPTDPRWVPREVRRTRDPAWDRRSHDERGSRAGSRAAHLLMGSADASIATRARRASRGSRRSTGYPSSRPGRRT